MYIYIQMYKFQIQHKLEGICTQLRLENLCTGHIFHKPGCRGGYPFSETSTPLRRDVTCLLVTSHQMFAIFHSNDGNYGDFLS